KTTGSRPWLKLYRCSAAKMANLQSPPHLSSSEEGGSVPVLVYEVSRGSFTQSAEPLRAVGSHPDKITFLYRIPVFPQPINPTAGEHQQTVLHYMTLDHGQCGHRLIRHGVHSEVESRIIRNEMQHFDRRIYVQWFRANEPLAAR